MASQRVQNYLEKHKIGPLFESLMGRLIQDTPDDPVGYIINILQGIHKKQRIVTDLNNHRRSSGSRPPSRDSRQRSSQNEVNGMESRSPNLAASWSAGAPQASSRSRDHPRPWTSNTETIENRTWSPEQKGRGEEPHPAWNSDTRVPTHDFDELFQMEQGEEKISRNPPRERYHGGKSWSDQDKAGHENISQSRNSLKKLPSDDLNSELELGQHQKSKLPSRNAEDVVSAGLSRSRPVKARRAVEEHRQQLQALLLEDNAGKSIEPKRLQHSPEEGMEILERMEDLQEEGIATAAKRGAKLKSKQSKGDENVSVTICARCARIIGGQGDDDASSQARSSFSPVPFGDITGNGDDFLDNYDGASQASEVVSSRQRNAWPTASDSESEITPRKSTVMFKQRVKSPADKENKHMFRNSSSPEPSSRISTSRSNYDVPDGFLNSQRKSWAANGYSSENETEMDASRPSTPGSMNGQPWDIPSDRNSDDESKVSRLGRRGIPRGERSSNRRSTKFTSDVASSIGDTDY